MGKNEKAKGRHAAAKTAYGSRGSIYVRIIDAENGLRLISGVRAVRIRSQEYNLLIMEDYLPALGKLDGNITFVTEDGETLMENIRGFYKHQHNEFTLLIEEQSLSASGMGEAAV